MAAKRAEKHNQNRDFRESLGAHNGLVGRFECHSADMTVVNDQRLFSFARMPMPPLDNPEVADLAPADPILTAYDEEHAVHVHAHAGCRRRRG
jgi:hypothetical protein